MLPPSSADVIEEMRAAEAQQQAEWMDMAAKSAAQSEKLLKAQARLDDATANEVKETMALLEKAQQYQFKAWEAQKDDLKEKLAEAKEYETSKDDEIRDLKRALEAGEAAKRAETDELKRSLYFTEHAKNNATAELEFKKNELRLAEVANTQKWQDLQA